MLDSISFRFSYHYRHERVNKMEDNSHLVKVLRNAFDATDTALKLAEDSVDASRNALAQAKLLFESIKEFDTETERVTCDNCHAIECQGGYVKCDDIGMISDFYSCLYGLLVF